MAQCIINAVVTAVIVHVTNPARRNAVTVITYETARSEHTKYAESVVSKQVSQSEHL